MGKLTWKDEHVIKQAVEAIDELKQQIMDIRQASGMPKIAKVQMLSRTPFGRDIHSFSNGFGSTKNESALERARAHLAEEEAKADDIHAANAPALESNRILREAFPKFMEDLGFSSGFYSLSGKGGKGQTTHAGWVGDLHSQVVCDDNYSAFKASADAFRRAIEKYAQDMSYERELARQARATRDAHADVIQSLGIKYGVIGSEEDDDMYDAKTLAGKVVNKIEDVITCANAPIPTDTAHDLSVARMALSYFSK